MEDVVEVMKMMLRKHLRNVFRDNFGKRRLFSLLTKNLVSKLIRAKVEVKFRTLALRQRDQLRYPFRWKFDPYRELV